MAACIIARRHGQLEVLQDDGGRIESSDEEENLDFYAVARERMPASSEAILDSRLLKLTSEYKWKPMRVVLTETKVTMAACAEGDERSLEFLKDSIPLEQITDIKGKQEVPERTGDGKLHSKQRLEILTTANSELGQGECIIQIRTVAGGHNSGRDYFFRATNETECNEWIMSLKSTSAKAIELHERAENKKMSRISWFRKYFKQKYGYHMVNKVIAALIITNFVMCIAEAQTFQSDNAYFFDTIDTAFTIIFSVELVFNIFANWFWAFFSHGWNVLDFIVVSISVIALMPNSVSGMKQLRLIRTLRVLRIFGRLSSFRQIFNALIASAIPVINSFLILGIIIALYAILGVNFYGDVDDEHFGTFVKAFFTMFQVCTGDGWAKDIARSLFGAKPIDPGVVMYFVSFIVIVGWTLVQVAVAVLLDNFMTASWNEKKAERKAEMEREGKGVEVCVLDPLLSAFSYFESLSSLRKQISSLFQFLDVNDTKCLGFLELREGLKKLPMQHQVVLQAEDFDEITNNREFCNSRGQLGPIEFENMIRYQLGLYVQRQMAEAMATSEQKSASSMLFFVTKVLAINLDEVVSTFRILASADANPYSPASSSRSLFKNMPKQQIPDSESEDCIILSERPSGRFSKNHSKGGQVKGTRKHTTMKEEKGASETVGPIKGAQTSGLNLEKENEDSLLARIQNIETVLLQQENDVEKCLSKSWTMLQSHQLQLEKAISIYMKRQGKPG